MINNRQNGRRRGRGGGGGGGGQRQGGGGGGPRDSGNRIDSRARGNASQLFEKYKNMARDAQLSGDRVQTEYYLQFADHYFRVLADQRGRSEERGDQRRSRDDFDQFDDGDDFGDDIENTAAPQRGDDRPERAERADRTERADRADRPDLGDDRRDRGGARNGAGSDDRKARTAAAANDIDGSAAPSAPVASPAASDEAGDDRRRRTRRPAARTADAEANGNAADAGDTGGVDAGIADRLPPSFGFAVEGERATEGEPAEDAPRPRRRRTRAAGGEAGPAN